MTRIRLTPRNALLLVGALLLIATVWWLASRPREPMLKGKPLSNWLTEGRDYPSADELRSVGPEAVQWLSSKAGQSPFWDIVEEEQEEERWPAAMRNRLRGLMRQSPFYSYDAHEKSRRVRDAAINALGKLGPSATPAIPSLMKAVQSRTYGTRRVAVNALLELRKTAWPAVSDAIRSSDERTQKILFDTLTRDWDILRPSDGADVTLRANYLVALMTARDKAVRTKGIDALERWAPAWSSGPHGGEAVGPIIQGLEQLSVTERRTALRQFRDVEFWRNSAFIVPWLGLLASVSDDFPRIDLLGYLANFDPDNPFWPEQLKKLTASPNPKVVEAATNALLHASKRLWEPSVQSATRPEKFAELLDFIVPLTTHANRALREAARVQLYDCLDAWATQPQRAEGVRLTVESLAPKSEKEKDPMLRVQILGALADLEPDNPRWTAHLNDLAASPNKDVSESAERALIHVLK